MRENRGAGAGCTTPLRSTNVPRCWLCGCCGASVIDNTGAKHWEVSYSYDLSRRTRIYTGYVKINNDDNASYNFNINAYPGNAGSAVGGPVGMHLGGFVMGMYHNF